MNEEEKEYAALMGEFRRVGITWAAFAELERRNAGSNAPGTPDGSVNLALDIPATTEFLRSLPDAAGQQGFLEAYEKVFAEPARRRFEAARKQWEQKQKPSVQVRRVPNKRLKLPAPTTRGIHLFVNTTALRRSLGASR